MDSNPTKPGVMDFDSDDSDEYADLLKEPNADEPSESMESSGLTRFQGSCSLVEPRWPGLMQGPSEVPPQVSSSSRFQESEVYFPPLRIAIPAEAVNVPITSQDASPNVDGEAHLSDVVLQEPEVKPTIPEVFYGKTILITGATGFIGKTLVEKLLRSCPGITEILLLIRLDERYHSPARTARLFSHKVFDRIKAECPAVMDKLRFVDGDITWENLGLEAHTLKFVRNEVSFIFHCASNVRFDCDPRTTLTANLLGVDYLLELCRTMKKLEAVVHVSTAYSFCNQPIIGEEVYPEIVRPEELLDVLEWMPPAQLSHLCNYIERGRPTLYHVSKAMSEILIAEAWDLPVIIVRPSIVTAAVKEPYPGWIDKYNGPSGFIALGSKGILKTVLVKDVTADWVPVDIVVNTLIAAAHLMALRRSREVFGFGLPVINCVCPSENNITWSEAVDICIPFLRKYPSAGIFREPGVVATASETEHNICRVVYHYLPAFFVDLFTCYAWERISLLCTYCKIHLIMDQLKIFTTKRFVFTSDNMRSLARDMSPEDSMEFNIDQRILSWTQYIEDYVHGVRKYYMNESDDTLPAARRRLNRLRVMYACAELVSAGILFYFICKCIDKYNIAIPWPIEYAAQVLQRLPFKRHQDGIMIEIVNFSIL